ncbi:MAG TPA: hypothetical protein VN317_09325 [Candidatus Methanoperedens sp.]|nr:hypothetical protein [Candidatus Methanoperedens sp.]
MAMPTLRQSGEPPACAFCGAALPRPRRRPWNEASLLPGGRCSCGGWFVVDPTGRNGGNALLEALADACGGDRSRSSLLVPGRDYEELIENYDAQLHRFIKGFRGYRRGMARLYLVRLIPAPAAPPQGATPAA